MSTEHRFVAIVEFEVCGAPMALAASMIDGIEPVATAFTEVPHLAVVLGESAPVESENQRVLRLESGVRVRVDGPVHLRDLAASAVTPLSNRGRAAVLGIAEIDGRSVLLLDSRSVRDAVVNTSPRTVI